jgi:hypothetical protein
LDQDIPESRLAQKWLKGGVDRNEAESELKNIETFMYEKQKQNENGENVPATIETKAGVKADNTEENTEIIKKQQKRIKKLQDTIQSYKILNDNYKNN